MRLDSLLAGEVDLAVRDDCVVRQHRARKAWDVGVLVLDVVLPRVAAGKGEPPHVREIAAARVCAAAAFGTERRREGSGCS